MKKQCSRLMLIGLLCAHAVVAAQTSEPAQLPRGVSDDPLLNSRFLLFGADHLRRQTLRWVRRHKRSDMIPVLIYSLRYLAPENRADAAETLRRLTGKRFGEDWFKWVQWQQSNEQIRPFAGFDVFQAALFSSLDTRFGDFIYPGVRYDIRPEEIVWGGVQARDGIPPLTNPNLVDAQQAEYLTDDDWVFGVEIDGDARAYPYRIMDWHEMLNDVVGGVPISLAYCTLCGSGILFDTRRPTVGRLSEAAQGAEPAERATQPGAEGTPFVFGSSGLLYRSNKLMFDYQTNSLWNQFTGRPVVGELAGSDLMLPTLPLVTTKWGEWRRQHPQTKVLDHTTGYIRDYTPGAPYGRYFRSSRLMFPVHTDDVRLKQKEEVFGLRMTGAEKAWPLRDFAGGQVRHDSVGVLQLVLVGDAATRSVRAYRNNGQQFEKVNAALTRLRAADGRIWAVSEQAIVGPDGEQLTRLPGHIAYWFAWHNYWGSGSLRLSH